MMTADDHDLREQDERPEHVHVVVADGVEAGQAPAAEEQRGGDARRTRPAVANSAMKKSRKRKPEYSIM